MGEVTIGQLGTWGELHNLPVGSIVRDVEGDEFSKVKGGRFEGIGGLNFSALGLAAFAPITLLNPEMLDPTRFREGDKVEVTQGSFGPSIDIGEIGKVVGHAAGIDGPLVEVEFPDGLHFPFHNSEIALA